MKIYLVSVVLALRAAVNYNDRADNNHDDNACPDASHGVENDGGNALSGLVGARGGGRGWGHCSGKN